jgi:hypothetical protein
LLRDRKLTGRADGTLDCYRVKAGHLARILGAELTLHEVMARKVDAFIDQRLEEGASRNTIHKELTVLRGTLKVAKGRGEFPGDIAAIMPDQFSAEYKPRERHQTPGEAQALLAELEPDRAARVARGRPPERVRLRPPRRHQAESGRWGVGGVVFDLDGTPWRTAPCAYAAPRRTPPTDGSRSWASACRSSSTP